MKKLQLGDGVSVPVSIVTEALAILAMRGAGKTNTARVLAEELHAAGAPFVVVDPVGSWWGLRADRNGKSGGLPIPIFGGEHGDVPLERTGGALVADAIVAQRLSCILDLSAFESEAAKRQFLLDFAQRLYQKNREPLHLFLEEADDYIPQAMGPEERHLMRAFENIVRRGRMRGLGITLITQRSAVINKNVLTQCGTLIAMRVTSPQDRDAVEAWIKYHGQKGEILESLGELESGEAWLWSPQFLKRAERVKFRLSNTYDSGATPKVGEQRRRAATLADVDLGKLREAMAATIEKAKADDPKELRAQVADLKKQLAARAPVGGVLLHAADHLQTMVAEVKELAGHAVAAARGAEFSAAKAFAKVEDFCKNLHAVAGPAWKWEPKSAHRHAASSPAPANAPARRPIPTPTGTQEVTGEKLGKCELAILAVLAQHGNQEKVPLGLLAGYSPSSSTFDNALGRLRTLKLVAPGNPIGLTWDGEARAPDLPPLPKGRELIGYWCAHKALGKCERALLVALVNALPGQLTREQLAEAAGYSVGSSTFDNGLGRLRSLGLVSGLELCQTLREACA